jgi:hypothetical protein
MGERWVSNLKVAYDKKRALEAAQRERNSFAAQQAAQMWKALRARVEMDVREYNRLFTLEPNCQVEVNIGNDLSVFSVERASYPLMKLIVSIKQSTLFTYTLEQQDSARAKPVIGEGTITIVAGQEQGEVYYEVDGQRILDVSEVSESLLTPALCR